MTSLHYGGCWLSVLTKSGPCLAGWSWGGLSLGAWGRTSDSHPSLAWCANTQRNKCVDRTRKLQDISPHSENIGCYCTFKSVDAVHAHIQEAMLPRPGHGFLPGRHGHRQHFITVWTT